MRYDFGKIKVVDIDTSKLAISNDYFYVKESEETEVKKDIEWLKEEIGELPCVDTVFNSDGSSYIDSAIPVMAVYDLINQLDEPEVTEEPSKEQVQKYLSEHGIAVVEKEPETVASVIVDFFKAYGRFKEVTAMEVKELEENGKD